MTAATTFYAAYAFRIINGKASIAYSRGHITDLDEAIAEAQDKGEYYGGGFIVVRTTPRKWRDANTMHVVDGVTVASSLQQTG